MASASALLFLAQDLSPSASPSLVLLLALIPAGAAVLGPLLVALIPYLLRGGKAKPVPELVSVSQVHELADKLGDVDEDLHRKDVQLRHKDDEIYHLKAERDAYYERAIRAETILAREGLSP